MAANVNEGSATSDVTPTEYGDFALKRFLGMELSGDEAGVGVAQVVVGDEHLNPNGVVHGAVLFALVDTAMAVSGDDERLIATAAGTFAILGD